MTKVYPKYRVSRDVWDLACERMVTCYKKFDTPVVWFSGGKDSTVVLHVAMEAARALNKLPVHVASWDEECIPPETVEYMERVRQWPEVNFKWLCMPIKHRNACSAKSPWWYPWAPEDEARWVRPLPANVITSLPTFQRVNHALTSGFVYPPGEYGTVCSLVGIRTQESLNRFRAIAGGKTGHDAYFIPDQWKHITRAYAIYDWNLDDVWTAPKKFGWDYNRAYDTMQAAGLSITDQRCAPPFGEQPLRALWTFHVCWPGLWDKMTTRVPGARTAARYSKTMLYGYGDDLADVKPPDLSWQDFIRQQVTAFPPEDRAACASQVNDALHWHRTWTKDPMPDDVIHPQSGLCWREIARVALRGDLKGRVMIGLLAKAVTQTQDKRRKLRAKAAAAQAAKEART